MRSVLRNLTLVDVRTGQVQPGAALLVEGATIAAVGRAGDLGSSDGAIETLDLAGRYVVPGFVDPHVHLAFSTNPDAIDRVGSDADPAIWRLAAEHAAQLLRAGVTTAADCGGPGLLTLQLKRAIERGTMAGPRLLVSLNPITTPQGHCHAFGAVARGTQRLAEVTRCLIDAGADFVKVMASGGGTTGATPASLPQYSVAELRAVVEVARASGRPVVAHARAPAAIQAAIEAGVDRIEHLTWEVADGVAYQPELAREMVRRGIWADPTLPAGYRAASSDAVAAHRRRELQQQFAWRYPNYRRMAQEAGLRLLCGTDAGTPLVRFDDFALGPELLVEVAGYSPAEALAAATLWGAEALGVAETRATIEPGKLADLVILRENPLASPSALRTVEGVMLGGSWSVPLSPPPHDPAHAAG